MEKKITIKKNVVYNIKESLINNINKIFSNPPSNHGYRHDIEVLLNELYIDEETYFYIIIECLSKEKRNREELNLIASYLFFMEEFIKILNDKESNKKETELLNELLNLSTFLYYLEKPKNVVLMRFGEKGNKAYINLNGVVDVLIKNSKLMKVNENEYLYYLACLIKYNEFALINLVINENFFNFPLLIYDDIESKTQINSVLYNISIKKGKNYIITFIKDENKEIKKIKLNINSLKNESKIKTQFIRKKPIIDPSIIVEYFNQQDEEEFQQEKKTITFNLKNAFKLNLKNEELKSKIEPYIISSKQLLDLFDLKYLNQKDYELNNCSTEEYINRISVYSKNEDNNLNDSNHSNDSLISLKIYTYTKVISLEKGSFFGELGLRTLQAVRTATIITSTPCHFSYLNKTTFNNCLKTNTELHLKQQLSFFINLPIFADIPITSFYKKYYTNISKYYIPKNNYILKQGEKPSKICLLNKGLFVLIVNANLSDLSNLIFFLLKKIKKYKGIDEKNDDKDILNSLTKNIDDEQKLLSDNIQFKNYYYKESLIKITELGCPDIIGYEELIGEDELYAFSIQAKTLENIIYTIDYNFYLDLFNSNISVQKHHKNLISFKLDLIIKRLLKIRNSAISSFFSHKVEEDISGSIFKEIENIEDSNRKLKRFMHFKSTKCSFIKKNNLSLTKEIVINDKENYKDKNDYYKINKTETNNINNNNIYNHNYLFFRNNSIWEKAYKKLIPPKTQISLKKPKKFLFDFDFDKNKNEEKSNNTINKHIYEDIKFNNDKENSSNNIKTLSNILSFNKNKIINLFPIYNLKKRLKTESYKINYNQNNFIENWKEIKGKTINNSIRYYFEKKKKSSKSLILKKKRQKIKNGNDNLNNTLNKEKESIEIITSEIDNELEDKISINTTGNNYKYFYFKGNKRLATPNNLKLNLLLLNNKSINFTNKDSFFHKNMKILTRNNPQNLDLKYMQKCKEEKINTLISEGIQNKKNKNKKNYTFKRNSYYKKNLSRIKLFYGFKKNNLYS